MIDSYFRKIYQQVCIEPILPFFKQLSPQTLTLASCLLGLTVCPLILSDFPWIALAVLMLSGFLDTLDGSLARYLHLASPKGAALDIVCDRIVEIAIIMGLFLFDPHTRALGSLLMLGSILLCITTFLVVGIFVENQSAKSFFYSPGLIERCEAFIFFSAMIVFPANFNSTAYLFSALTLFTALFRLWEFMRCKNSTSLYVD